MADGALSTGVYIGIDSGGTRTNIHIVIGDGSRADDVASYEIGESLSGALPPRLIVGVLRKIFAPLETRIAQMPTNGLPAYGWISAAGYSPWTRQHFIDAVEELNSIGRGCNLQSIGVANDAVSLLYGSKADGIVIAGTGSSTVVKSSDGTLYQAGGRDWVASDYGSGFWIGLQAIRQAYRDYEAGEDSVLLQRLRDVYGVRNDDDRQLIAKLRDMSIGDENMKKEIARVTASVCAAAERGDLGAQNIVKAEAEDLADVTAGSLRRRFSREELAAGIDIVRCGSVIGNPFYRSAFESQVERRLLSGSDQRAQITWREAATGREAAVELARRVHSGADDLLRLDLDFRPAVIRI